jgi:ribosomal subunit interface protein
MELKISAKNLNVSDRFRDYVEEKAGKIDRYAHKPEELNIKVTRHEHSKTAGAEDQVELTVYELEPAISLLPSTLLLAS